MRGLLCLVLYCLVGVQVTLAQRRRYFSPYVLRMKTLQRTNGQSLGPIDVHSVIGELPIRYVPLTYNDEIATAKVKAKFSELLRLFPDIDLIKTIGPIEIDYPELSLRGKVYLNNIIVEGEQQIELKDLEIRTGNNRVDFTAYAPFLSVKADVKVEGFLGEEPLNLSGSFSVNIKDLKLVGAIATKKVNVPQQGEVYQVDGIYVSVHLNELNIYLGHSSGEAYNLGSLTSEVVAQLKHEMANLSLDTVLKQVNNVLARIPAATIDTYLQNNL